MDTRGRKSPRGHCPSRQRPGQRVAALPHTFHQDARPRRMDDPDLLAGAVEHLLHAALLSGPEPAKTLPVYDSASHADPSRGRDCAGNVDKHIPVP